MAASPAKKKPCPGPTDTSGDGIELVDMKVARKNPQEFVAALGIPFQCAGPTFNMMVESEREQLGRALDGVGAESGAESPRLRLLERPM